MWASFVLLLVVAVEACRVTIPGVVRANCVTASFGNYSRPVTSGQLFSHEHGCGQVVQQDVGGIMMVGRGNCSFTMKGWWAWQAGAKAILVVNSKGADPFTMNVHPKELGAVPNIPLVLISFEDGEKLNEALDGAQADVTLRLGKRGAEISPPFQRTQSSDTCVHAWAALIVLLGCTPFALALWKGASHIHASVMVGMVATVAYCLAVLFQQWEFGSLQGGWASKYYSKPQWGSMGALTAALLSALVLEKVSSRCRASTALVVWFVGGLGIQCILQYALPWSATDLIVDDSANGFYGAVVTGELKNESLPGFLFALQNGVQREGAPPLPEHVRTNLPGKSTFFFAVRLLTESPTTIALLIMVISNTGGLLVHQIAKELYGDERTARYAFVLYLLHHTHHTAPYCTIPHHTAPYSHYA
jgi:hypothetical protein